MTQIRSQLRRMATVCATAYVIGVVFAPAVAFACEGGGEEIASLGIMPNPLVFTASSKGEEPITLSAGGAAGDEAEVLAGGVGAITVTKGPAGWAAHTGTNCETKRLVVGGATCVEKIKDVKFPPKSGETYEAEYGLTWESVKPLAGPFVSTVYLKAKS